jgi:hypothetical protein
MKPKPPQCEATKANGDRCKANALPGQNVCMFHCPKLAGARKAGRKAGGRNRRPPIVVLPADTADWPLKTVGDVVEILAATINQTRRGELDVRVANSIGQLSNVLLHALKDGEMEQRIAALEARVAAQAGYRTNGRAFA